MNIYHFITLDYIEFKIYKNYGICSPQALYDLDKDLFHKTTYENYKERTSVYCNKSLKEITNEDVLKYLNESPMRTNNHFNSSSIFFTFSPFKELPVNLGTQLIPCIQLTVNIEKLSKFKPILVYHYGKEMTWNYIQSNKFKEWYFKILNDADVTYRKKIFKDVPHLAINAYNIPLKDIHSIKVINKKL